MADSSISNVTFQVSARSDLGLATTDSPEFAGLNLGNASDTTLTRVSAGVVAVEGTQLATIVDIADVYVSMGGFP